MIRNWLTIVINIMIVNSEIIYKAKTSRFIFFIIFKSFELCDFFLIIRFGRYSHHFKQGKHSLTENIPRM